MIATRLISTAIAAAAVAAATITAAPADERLTIGVSPPYRIGPVLPEIGLQEVPNHPLRPCADPTPLSIGFSSGTASIPYHGTVPAVIITGTVTNLGPGTFTPSGGQQEIQLWIKWGSGSHSLLATAPLGTLGVNQTQAMTGAVSTADYGGLFDVYGAPHIRLMVVSSGGDCQTGLSNQAAGYGPPLSSI
ncbi:MAG: hypothetical protein H6842_12670 [Rhodospirillaceae bacterium]|nr:hypothetical protein [Rhodospirillaceae bacterium]